MEHDNILDDVLKIEEEPTKPAYPSLAQGFGLLGIVIIVQLILSIPTGPLLMTYKGSIISSIIFFLIYVGTFGLVALAAFRLRGSRQLSWATFPKISLPILAIATIALIIARLPLIEIFPKEWLEAFLEATKDMLQIDWVTLITISIAAPILEEIIFRGVILDGFLKRYSPWKAIFWSSVLFGLAHMNPFQFISAFLIGMFMGWVYLKTKSLFLCIFIHFINNFTAFIPAFFSEDYMDESSVNPSESFGSIENYYIAIAVSTIIILVCIYLLTKIFNNQKKIA